MHAKLSSVLLEYWKESGRITLRWILGKTGCEYERLMKPGFKTSLEFDISGSESSGSGNGE
jgi:hypothetical protein